MQEHLLSKLNAMHERCKELEAKISDADVIANDPAYTAYLKEHGRLARIMTTFDKWRNAHENLAEHRGILEADDDAELVEIARAEVPELEAGLDALERELAALLASEDKDADKDIIVEIRAGTGGEEAALFAMDLYRMYEKYAQKQGWRTEEMSFSEASKGGAKEVVFAVHGDHVYQKLRYESGGHRVQRVPATETQGRVHTSAATVAVLPEAEEREVEIDPNDLRIDTFHSSGPGGQHANKTSSAVRITHEPSGIVVSCQDEKSQHKNKAKAMRILRSRLYEAERRKAAQARDDMRRSQIGTGDRSDRIRTYNFPQNRLTDHRVNYTSYSLDRIIEGELDELLQRLAEYHVEQCAERG